jgi:surface protein
MPKMFYNSVFNGDISQWNTSSVNHMHLMFCQSAFNGDISQWDTSSVKEMNSMFKESVFNGDISKWDTSNVEDMGWMFAGAVFNGDLRPWNLTDQQMLEAFKETLPNYLAIRQNIEEAEKLHATFGGSTPRAKKAL